MAKNQSKTDPEISRRKKEEQARRSRRRTRQWIGVALTFLVIVGVVSIVRTGIEVTRNLLDNSSERKEFEMRIRPLVWFDVLPFTDVGQLEQNTIKQVAIWGIIDEVGREALPKNSEDLIIIPTVDVDQYARELFGKNFTFQEHGAFDDKTLGLVYEFNEENSYYVVPGTSLELAYTPTVVDINNMGNGIKQVVVGYVSLRNTEGGVLNEPDYEHPVLYMNFYFQRDGGEYYLYAMERNTTQTVITASSSSSSSSQSIYLPPEDESLSDDYVTISVPSTSEEIQPESTPEDSSADGSTEDTSVANSGTNTSSSSSDDDIG